MKINKEKTKVMKFNMRKKYDFPVRLSLENNEYLEVVDNCKLLGTIISSDLKWEKNTKNLIKKTMSSMWMLRRLKNQGLSIEEMLEVYCLEIRSKLELACPLWHSAITLKEKNDIERIRKIAFHIILGRRYSTYQQALDTLGQDTLELRRQKQTDKFSRKYSRDPRQNKNFRKIINTTRAKDSKKFYVPYYRTARYEKSAVPYFLKLLNET